MNKVPVKVVIPVYKKELSALEMLSLNQAYTVLKHFPLVIVKPESLDLSCFSVNYPNMLFESFADCYFESIQGYNRLMLSSAFYGRFLDSEFILIYQLDAFVFRDELAFWCSKGYDYIGAPWLKKPIYHLPVISTINAMIAVYYRLRQKKSKHALYNKVGNGGFSLRKTASFYNATQTYHAKITDFFQQKQSHLFNEDVFWATEIPDFSYPSVSEALRFSFDKYPHYCFRLTNSQLPFGCHGWNKRKMRRFWKPVIGY